MRRVLITLVFFVVTIAGTTMVVSATAGTPTTGIPTTGSAAEVRTSAAKIDLKQYKLLAEYKTPGHYIWRRPHGVTTIVLVGCGGGGGGGGAGGAINVVNPILSDNGGGGGGGAGAPVIVTTIAVSAGSYQVEIGQGGVGGAPGPSQGDGGRGSDGTDTIFGPATKLIPGTRIPVDTRSENFPHGTGGGGGVGARPPRTGSEYVPHDGRGGAAGSCSGCTAGGRGGDPGKPNAASGDRQTDPESRRPINGGSPGGVSSDHGGGAGGGGGASHSPGGEGGSGGDDGTATIGRPQFVSAKDEPRAGKNAKCLPDQRYAVYGSGGGGGGGNGGMDYAGTPGGCGGWGLLRIYGKK